MFELVPRSLSSPLARLRREMDDLWGRFYKEEPFTPWSSQEGFQPSVDLKETDKAFELTADVPGMQPKDIQVSLTGDVLTIKGEKKSQREEKDGDYHLVERSFGSFQRSFRLPVSADNKKLEAKFKDGVLKITLPKSEKSQTKQIEVKGE
jgi:HSP20 family protein